AVAPGRDPCVDRHGLRGRFRGNAVGLTFATCDLDVVSRLLAELPRQHEAQPMKLVLKGFQEDAVATLVRNLRAAAKDSKRDRQAVSLSSPTGSGKTVMLTRAIEILLEGDDEHARMADATFLWITDQPELNEQTRKKMLVTSSVLNNDNIIVIDNT